MALAVAAGVLLGSQGQRESLGQSSWALGGCAGPTWASRHPQCQGCLHSRYASCSCKRRSQVTRLAWQRMSSGVIGCPAVALNGARRSPRARMRKHHGIKTDCISRGTSLTPKKQWTSHKALTARRPRYRFTKTSKVTGKIIKCHCDIDDRRSNYSTEQKSGRTVVEAVFVALAAVHGAHDKSASDKARSQSCQEGDSNCPASIARFAAWWRGLSILHGTTSVSNN